jgi:Predicted integral membrane protein
MLYNCYTYKKQGICATCSGAIKYMKLKLHNVLLITIIVLIIATLAFIWINSSVSPTTSDSISNDVYESVESVTQAVTGSDSLTNHIVRKAAHFIEYAVLGIELSLLLILIKKIRLQPIINCAFAGFATAVIDETIQIFSGRGSNIPDVWIDFAGFCSGFTIIMLFTGLIKLLHKKR